MAGSSTGGLVSCVFVAGGVVSSGFVAGYCTGGVVSSGLVTGVEVLVVASFELSDWDTVLLDVELPEVGALGA